jgi:hypothetical protein
MEIDVKAKQILSQKIGEIAYILADAGKTRCFGIGI